MYTFYFYISPFIDWQFGKSRYQHEIIVLAEGLTAIGCKCIGNFDYWTISSFEKKFLINFEPEENVKISDAVIVSGMYYGDNAFQLPSHLSTLSGKIPLIFTDLHDGYFTPTFYKDMRIFDLILKCHYNIRYNNPANVVPWAFGISNRYLNFIHHPLFAAKQRSVLWNFRNNHDLRRRALLEIKPIISKYFSVNESIDVKDEVLAKSYEERFWWEQSGQRHNQQYFQRLSHSQIVACFGGGVIGSIKSNSLSAKIFRKATDPLFRKSFNTIYQWDSYRLWETLTAGSVPLMYNLFDLGARFPINPEANIHYWGLDLFNPIDSINEIVDNPDKLINIASSGHKWALEHYAPIPTAKRFLNLIDGLKIG